MIHFWIWIHLEFKIKVWILLQFLKTSVLFLATFLELSHHDIPDVVLQSESWKWAMCSLNWRGVKKP